MHSLFLLNWCVAVPAVAVMIAARRGGGQDEWNCPITTMPFEDPVKTKYGHHFENSAIKVPQVAISL